ncbi:unnamed protein product [Closterium sp. NIES-53]
MDAEFNSLIDSGTRELVELPKGRRPISSKWVFKVKSEADGALERFKSRLVAKGFQQKERVDFGEVFVPIAKPMTLRTSLAGAAMKGWYMKQMDITTTFLNGVLLEDIYMAQPVGYEDGTSRPYAMFQPVGCSILVQIACAHPPVELTLPSSIARGPVSAGFVVLFRLFRMGPDGWRWMPLRIEDDDAVLVFEISSRAAEPPSSRAARRPIRPAAEPPARRAAQQPSRPTAEPPSSRAARPPSRPAAEPPNNRAARQPSRPAAELPSRPVEVAEVAEAAEAAVELVAALGREVAPVAVSASSSSAVVRPRPRSSFVSGTLGVSAFPDATEIPRWGDLSRAGVAIFDLDYDAILAAIYAVSTSDEGDCYLCLPPDPGGQAAALHACEAAAQGASASTAPGAGESALSDTASAQVFHTFNLDSGASRSFFRDRTTLTPLSRPVAVTLAEPLWGSCPC